MPRRPDEDWEFEQLVSQLDDVAAAGRRIAAQTPVTRTPRVRRPRRHRPQRRRGGAWLQWTVVGAVVLAAGYVGVRDWRSTMEHAPQRGRGYAFAQENAHGDAYRYPPCAILTVVHQRAGMPAGAEAELQAALQEVSRASGVEFVVVDEEPLRSSEYVVTLSWATERTDPQLAGARAGYAGSQPGPGRYFQSGAVVIDAAGPGANPGQLRLTLMHEFAHVLGLAHVDDESQLMHPEYREQPGWGAGDLAGLAQLGSCEDR